MTSRPPFLNLKFHNARGRLQRQRGEGLLGYLIALGLFAVMLPSAMQLMQRSMDLDTAGAAAFHAAQVSEARDRYVKDNYVTILANAAAGPVPITTTMLKNAGYLDSGISDNNVHNQTYETRAVKVTAGGNDLLRVLTVTSGGQAFSETEIRNIAAKTARIGGGYVSATNTAVAQGYQGSYQVALGDYGLAPGAGHVAIGGFFNSQGVLGDYLYRNAIPGHPELNQMNTALSMGGNAINNVSTLTASGKITTTNDVQGRDLLATRDISAARNIAAAGEVRAASMTSTGTITAGGNVTSSGTVSGAFLRPTVDAAEGAGCSPNGLIAKNYAGLILSCQSGVWRTQGKGTLQRYTWYATPPGPTTNNYGDICQAQLDSWGWSASGWVATGSDACTEDGEECTSDGVRCFAVTLGP